MIDDRVASLLAEFSDAERGGALSGLLAERFGSQELMIFILDEEVGVYLPAAGFSQTLQEGHRWQEFLGECDSAGRASEIMTFPSRHRVRAHGVKVDTSTIIVLGGETPDFVALDGGLPLLRLLARVLRGERAVASARGCATAAAQAASYAEEMARALEQTRRELQKSLESAEQAEAALKQAHDQLEQKVAERTAELRNRADQLARLTSELTTAEQRERRRLAQVLHDHLQQILVAARMSLHVLAERAEEAQRAAINNVQDLLKEAIDSSRSLTVELSPPILHDAGLTAGLQWLARWFLEKHGLQVDIKSEPGTDVGREDVRILLFQAARELLFNIVKHAGVRRATVHLAPDRPGFVRLTVSDRGQGFDPAVYRHGGDAASGGFGLFSIRERLGLLGGTFEIQSTAGNGCKIVVVSPSGPSASSLKAPMDCSTQERTESKVRAVAPDRAGGIRVLVVDDHEVVRQGLRMLLSNEPTLEVVGEASDGYEALAEAERLQPDVVLMDFSMPRMNGIEATHRLRQSMPDVRVVALSMYNEPDRAQAMLDAGASAYVVKSGRSEALIQTIRNVVRHTPTRPRAAPLA